jgi:hypothetical protein
MFPRLGDNTICLMAELRGQFAVPLQHLFRRKQFLAVACTVGGNLRCASTIPTYLL